MQKPFIVFVFCLRYTPALTLNRYNISTAALSTSLWVVLYASDLLSPSALREENTDQVQVCNNLKPPPPSLHFSLCVLDLSDHTSSLTLWIFFHSSLLFISLFIFSVQTDILSFSGDSYPSVFHLTWPPVTFLPGGAGMLMKAVDGNRFWMWLENPSWAGISDRGSVSQRVMATWVRRASSSASLCNMSSRICVTGHLQPNYTFMTTCHSLSMGLPVFCFNCCPHFMVQHKKPFSKSKFTALFLEFLRTHFVSPAKFTSNYVFMWAATPPLFTFV